MSTQGTRRRRSGSKAGSLAGKSLKISTDQKIKIAKQGSLFCFVIIKGSSINDVRASVGYYHK